MNPDRQALLDALAHISQGVIVLDAAQRIHHFNPQVCELLDLPSYVLTGHPTIQEVTLWQEQRGDFKAPQPWLQDALGHYLHQVAQGGRDQASERYQRVTPHGRVIDVRTDPLPDGGAVRVFTDITPQVLEHHEYLRLSELTRQVQTLGLIGGWEVDVRIKKIFWTEGTYRIFDTTPEAFTPTPENTRALFTDAAWAVVQASYADAVNQPTQHQFEIEMFTLTGRRIWVLSMGHTEWDNGKPVRRTAIVQDITERKNQENALRESEARWKLALESSGDGLWDLNIQTGEEYLSPSLLRMYGYDPGARFTMAERDQFTHPDDRAAMQRARQQHLDAITPTYSNEHRVRCKDGSWRWVLSRGMVILRDAQGNPLRMIGTHTDITERKNAESLIWAQAHFDPLTGLPNRRMLRERLEQEIKKCRRDGYRMAVLFVDLDRFKEVNDTYGHDQGDLLLVQAARRIAACLREVDTVARMGGDEFTVLVTDLPTIEGLASVLQKILHALSQAFDLAADQVFVSASIGVTIYPDDASQIDDLLKQADQALYVAKSEGRNRYHFFTAALQHAAQHRAQITHDLRLALAQQQFVLLYQPIIDLSNGVISKAEALVRWQHPERGLVSPAEFIALAESSGLIVPLGEWVFQQAARQVRRWRDTVHPHFQISVNKSPVQFENPNPRDTPWIDQLKALNLDGGSIVVEITEGLLLSTSDGVIEQLLRLGDDGIQVALDDFGTGYSSLAYLQKFDIDYIKIDQSFVRQLVEGSTDLALCQAIIAMAHTLGMKVIAEGIETDAQRQLLTDAGCDYGQGYLFSRPLSPADFEQWLDARWQGSGFGELI